MLPGINSRLADRFSTSLGLPLQSFLHIRNVQFVAFSRDRVTSDNFTQNNVWRFPRIDIKYVEDLPWLGTERAPDRVVQGGVPTRRIIRGTPKRLECLSVEILRTASVEHIEHILEE